jgi:hypothetical protein
MVRVHVTQTGRFGTWLEARRVAALDDAGGASAPQATYAVDVRLGDREDEAAILIARQLCEHHTTRILPRIAEQNSGDGDGSGQAAAGLLVSVSLAGNSDRTKLPPRQVLRDIIAFAEAELDALLLPPKDATDP